MNKIVIRITIIILISGICLLGCAANTDIEPLGEGEKNFNFSLGGPVISALGLKFPAPYLITGGSYGYKDDLNFTANLHLISLVYGVAGAEIGAKKYFRTDTGKNPIIGVGANFLLLSSIRSRSDEKFRLYPYFSATSTWKKERSAYYIGANLATPISSMDYFKEAPPVIFSPFVGYRKDIGVSTKLIVEFRFSAANHKTDQLSVEYLNIGGNGALAPMFALERSF